MGPYKFTPLLNHKVCLVIRNQPCFEMYESQIVSYNHTFFSIDSIIPENLKTYSNLSATRLVKKQSSNGNTYSCIFSDYFSRGDCLFLEESRQGEHVLSNFFLRRLVSLHQGVEVVPPVSHIFIVVAPVSLTDVSSTGRIRVGSQK